MKRDFYEKVLRAGRWYGKKYFYVARGKYDHWNQWTDIERLPLIDLNTTASLNKDNWEIVYSFGKNEADTLRADYSRPACYKLRIGDYAVMVIREDGLYDCYLKKYTDDSTAPYPYLYMFGLPCEKQTAKEALDIAARNIQDYEDLFDEC